MTHSQGDYCTTNDDLHVHVLQICKNCMPIQGGFVKALTVRYISYLMQVTTQTCQWYGTVFNLQVDTIQYIMYFLCFSLIYNLFVILPN